MLFIELLIADWDAGQLILIGLTFLPQNDTISQLFMKC